MQLQRSASDAAYLSTYVLKYVFKYINSTCVVSLK